MVSLFECWSGILKLIVCLHYVMFRVCLFASQSDIPSTVPIVEDGINFALNKNKLTLEVGWDFTFAPYQQRTITIIITQLYISKALLVNYILFMPKSTIKSV